jgi:AcrR family transcriptional regulator
MAEGDSTRSRLLEAAGAEFAERGFAEATVRGILRRAGMQNVAAIHYYFGDKERLYTEAVVDAHLHGGTELKAEDEAGLAAEERLRCFVREFVGKVLSLGAAHDWRDRLLMRELMSPSVATDALVRTVIRQRFGRLRSAIKDLAPSLAERRLNVLCFTVVGQCIFYRLCRPFAERLIGTEEFASLDVDYLTDHITSVALAAVRAAQERSEEGPCPGSR